MIKNLLIIVLILLKTTLFAQYKTTIDSLKQELTNFDEDTNKVNILLQLGKQYKQNSSDTSLTYFQKALKLTKKINALSYSSICLENIGSFYTDNGNYTKAIKYYQDALVINKRLKNKSGIAKNFSDIGLIYYYQSNYDKALYYFEKALKINVDTKNKNAIARTLGNIGNIFYVQMDYNKAIEYYQKTLELNILNLGEHHSNIALNYKSIGAIVLDQGEYDKALEYFDKGLKLQLELTGEQNSKVASFSLSELAVRHPCLAPFMKMRSLDQSRCCSLTDNRGFLLLTFFLQLLPCKS